MLMMCSSGRNFYFWFKYDLGQKYYAPLVQPDRCSNSWPPDHDSTLHITKIPALTTWPSVNFVLPWVFLYQAIGSVIERDAGVSSYVSKLISHTPPFPITVCWILRACANLHSMMGFVHSQSLFIILRTKLLLIMPPWHIPIYTWFQIGIYRVGLSRSIRVVYRISSNFYISGSSLIISNF